MRFGKLSAAELKENIFSVVKSRRGEVKVSAAAGEDCAALDIKGLIAVSSDPITGVDFKGGAARYLGRLAVYVPCNDLAACGAEPVALTLTVIMPQGARAADVKTIMSGAEEAAAALNADIVGGHTEFSDAVNRPAVCATAIGGAERFVKSAGAAAGRKLLMTKSAGIEAAAIAAVNAGDAKAAEYFFGKISVVKEGLLLAAYGADAMHDVTEGGVLGAAEELCAGAGLGAVIYKDKIPVEEKTLALLKGGDPYTAYGSGSLLFTCADCGGAVKLLEKNGVDAAVIGEFTAGGGLRIK